MKKKKSYKNLITFLWMLSIAFWVVSFIDLKISNPVNPAWFDYIILGIGFLFFYYSSFYLIGDWRDFIK